MNDKEKLVTLTILYTLRQWFHSIHALVSTNIPLGLYGRPCYGTVKQIKRLAWEEYCRLGDEISNLKKGTSLEDLS